MDISPEKLILWLKAHRAQHFSLGIFVAFIITLIWFLGSVMTPFLAPADTIDFGDDGRTGYREHAQIINENVTNGLARFYYTAGDLNCHQISERSWFLNGNQMPFCSRDISIFFGLALGALAILFLAFELNVFWILLGFVPIGIDGALQLVTSYESTNLLRALTGTLAGITTGIMLGTIIREAAELLKFRKERKKFREKGPE